MLIALFCFSQNNTNFVKGFILSNIILSFQMVFSFRQIYEFKILCSANWQIPHQGQKEKPTLICPVITSKSTLETSDQRQMMSFQFLKPIAAYCCFSVPPEYIRKPSGFERYRKAASGCNGLMLTLTTFATTFSSLFQGFAFLL